MEAKASPIGSPSVAPFMGAWIETGNLYNLEGAILVAPFMC